MQTDNNAVERRSFADEGPGSDEAPHLTFTREELILVSNALNEACNGTHITDNEFHTRLGGSREEARVVLWWVTQALGGNSGPMRNGFLRWIGAPVHFEDRDAFTLSRHGSLPGKPGDLSGLPRQFHHLSPRRSPTYDALPELLQRFEVIHAVGTGKAFPYEHERYHQYALLTDMSEAYAVADLVLCRAGVGTITELAAAKKVAIVVPMPDSHQEENALYLHDMHAAMVYAQDLLDGERLAVIAASLLYESELKTELSEHVAEIMPPDAVKKITQKIIELSGVIHE